MQLRLEKDMTEANAPDGYVYEEIAEIFLAQNQPALAKPYFAKAAGVLGADSWFVESERARLTRLQELAR